MTMDDIIKTLLHYNVGVYVCDSCPVVAECHQKFQYTPTCNSIMLRTAASALEAEMEKVLE